MAKKNETAKQSQQDARKDAFIKLGIIVVAIVLTANTIQLAQFGSIVQRVDMYNKGIVDEFGSFKEDVVSFGNDINEMRGYLLLPTKQYSFMEDVEEQPEAGIKEGSQTEQALYTFISQFTDEKKLAENAAAADARMSELTKSQDFISGLDADELKLGRLESDEISATVKVMAGSDAVFAIIADKDTNTMRVQSALGSENIDAQGTAAESTALLSYISRNKQAALDMKEVINQAKEAVVKMAKDAEITAVLKDKGMAFDEAPAEDDDSINYNYLNSEGTPLITVTIARADGSFKLGEGSYSDDASLKAALLQALNDVDAGTELEKMIKSQREELEAVINSEAFQDVLAHSGLAVETEPREDYNKLLYDVKNQDGQLQFSFVIELSSGMFKILRDDEEIDLSSVLLGSKKNS